MKTGFEFIGGALFCALFSLMFVWMLVNFITGCGETFYTATGTMAGECIGPLELFGLK